MRVFVAGATGDLGRAVVRQLTAAGYQVTGMTRQRAKVSMVEAAGARAAVADVFDPEAVRRAVAEASPEGVVDLLTAFPRRGPLRVSDFEATDRIRRQGTANVLGAAIASGARRYVAESVAFTYRWNEGERSTEESPLLELERAPGVFHRAFGGALAKERQVREAAHEGRIEGIVLRFGAFYGPEAGSTEELVRLARRGRLYLPGGGPAVIPWIHVEDAASATVAALERARPGEVYNVVDDEAVTVGEFAAELARVLGAKEPRGVPRWMARATASFAARFFTEARLRVSNAKAKRDLGWAPSFPTYREGLRALTAAPV